MTQRYKLSKKGVALFIIFRNLIETLGNLILTSQESGNCNGIRTKKSIKQKENNFTHGFCFFDAYSLNSESWIVKNGR